MSRVVSGSFQSKRPSLLNADDGGVSTLFAIALPVLLATIGGAVDYSSLASQQSQIRQAADSAALAVARQMTMMQMSDTQLQAAVQQFAVGNGKLMGIEGLKVSATPTTDRLGIQVNVAAPAKSMLGLTTKLAGVDTLSASATARVGQKTKLCLLSVSEAKSNEFPGGVFRSNEPTGIDIQNDARLTAPDCMIHTNVATTSAFTIGSGAKVTAGVLCAAGGVKNTGGSVEAAVVDTCPVIANPMDGRYYPNLGQNCEGKIYKDIIFKTGDHKLQPGNYCGSIILEGDARVTLQSGNYAIQGELITRGSSQLIGSGVGLYLWGGKASDLHPAGFSFLENSLIDISAPETGPMAGILIWEGINGAAFDYKNDVEGSNYHQINTLRARRLTGTIYLPGGRLLIDAPAKVAEESDYTVLLVNRLDLSDGPNLVLNSNYEKSRVPVPYGLGPIGAKNVRLEK